MVRIRFRIRDLLVFTLCVAVAVIAWGQFTHPPQAVLDLISVSTKLNHGMSIEKVHHVISLGPPDVASLNPSLSPYEKWNLPGGCQMTIFYTNERKFNFVVFFDRFGNLIGTQNEENNTNTCSPIKQTNVCEKRIGRGIVHRVAFAQTLSLGGVWRKYQVHPLYVVWSRHHGRDQQRRHLHS